MDVPANTPASAPTTPNRNVSLAAVTLSGGGFRATLFHLGAVLWLRKEQLLDGKTRIYGVSGGAILAAHLGVNWDKYLGSEEELQSCIESLLRLIRSDIRNRVFRRWLFFYLLFATMLASWAVTVWLSIPHPVLQLWPVAWIVLAATSTVMFITAWIIRFVSPSRTRILEAQYNSYLFTQRKAWNRLHSFTLQDLPDNAYISSTSLSSGQMIAFAKSRITIYDRDEHEQVSANKPRYPLARAVCCSSAFPPAFPPVHLTKADMGTVEDGRYHAVTDGGVHDNLGVQLFVATSPTEADSIVLVSDAGRPLEHSDHLFRGTLSRNMRASDLLMYRIAYHDLRSVSQQLDGKYQLRHCQIYPTESEKRHSTIDDATQLMIAQIRTDLNTFTDDEVFMLVKHGAESARTSLGNPAARMGDEDIRKTCGLKPDAEALEKSFERRHASKTPIALWTCIGWLNQARSFVAGADTVVLLWIFPLLFVLLVTGTYWNAVRDGAPKGIAWDTEYDISNEILVDSLLKEISVRLQVNGKGGRDEVLCTLVSKPLGGHIDARFVSDFKLQVPYESVRASDTGGVQNCWLFIRRPGRGEGGVASYSEVRQDVLDAAYSFTISGALSDDRLILVTRRLEEDHCDLLARAIIVKGP